MDIAKDAERFRALIKNTGGELVVSRTPGAQHAIKLTIDVTGCEKFTADGAVDFPATIRAALDDEIELQKR